MPDETTSLPELTQAQQFQLGMLQTTPKVFVTHTLVAINLAVFVAMLLNGVSLLDPTTQALIRWGADYGPLTTHGQWWRLVTSAFIHIGIIHILMNMYILYTSGIFVERLFGNLGFAVLYMLAGIGGNLVSVAWHPTTVAAGASGAIFGVYGGLFAFLLMQRSAIPAPTVKALFRNAVIFLGYNLVYGASKAHVDMSAHLGGFASGFLVGCALAQPFTASRDSRMNRSVLVSILGLVICAGCAMKIPRVDDLEAAFHHLDAVETPSLKLFNDSLDQLQSGKLTAPQFSDIVHNQLLPPWNAEKVSLQKLAVSGAQKDLVGRLTQYMSLRAEGWSLIAEGASQGNSDLIKQANQKQDEAEQIVKSLNNSK